MSSNPWTWHDVKCELAKRGVSLKTLARKIGVTPQAVGKVKNSRSTKVQGAIARELGCRPEKIWPDRYPFQGRAA